MHVPQVLFSFSLLHLIHSHLQINLHRTHAVSEDASFQHHCLQVPAYRMQESDPRQIISYCLGQWPFNLAIKENNRDQKFTFEQLAKQNITHQQLYLWSASIDLIEQYQFYLNQLNNKSHETLLGSAVFYNCTFPYFGPQCEYVLEDHQPYHSSLDEIVHDYYRYNLYEPTVLTCYIHLECNRGPSPLCLDWREICDGKVDCLDDGLDEEHCWQLEIQPYDENDDPLARRRCISKRYFRDDSDMPACMGESSLIKETTSNQYENYSSLVRDPTFEEEDISCTKQTRIGHKMLLVSYKCSQHRLELARHAIFSVKPAWLSDQCWSVLRCTNSIRKQRNTIFNVLCNGLIIHQIINATCPDMIMISTVPLLLGHIYLVYNKTLLVRGRSHTLDFPCYFCYNDQLLHMPNSKNKTIFLYNKTCHVYEVPLNPLSVRASNWFDRCISPLDTWLRRYAIFLNENLHCVNQSMVYQCKNSSKNISTFHLTDGIKDCPYLDDEDRSQRTCSTEQNTNSLICPSTNQCLAAFMIEDNYCDCEIDLRRGCADENPDLLHSLTKISFQTICNNYTNLYPQLIDNSKETDETNCEHWPLIHVYNHCNGFWDASDGADELNCDPSPLINCSMNEHICVSPQTNQLMCLSMNKSNDGIVDCLGAGDEPGFCQSYSNLKTPLTFYCNHDGHTTCNDVGWICDKNQACSNREDEQACQPGDFSGVSLFEGVCHGNYESHGSDAAKVICRRFSYVRNQRRVYFTVNPWSDLIKRRSKQDNELFQQSLRQTIESYQPRCHRGLSAQIWLDKDKNRTENVCFCPPSYYGDQCQYQNERVSLSLMFQVASDSLQTLFAIIVHLIDNTNYERIIHSSEQFNYLAVENCRRRFDLYLLYSHRPKDQKKDYFIQIDVYEKETLNYRGSFLQSLNFTFLPVHRLVLQIFIPHATISQHDCSDDQCEHGKCQKYLNDPANQTFCQCDQQWSGHFCNIPYNSICSSDSLSVGKLADNQPLCVCPKNKIGPRCLMDDNACQEDTCSNNGKCISVDEYQVGRKRFLCVCPRNYTGDQCEILRTQLTVTFDENLSFPSLILIHFIEVKLDSSPIRTTTFKTIPLGQNGTTIYWSLPFHLVFIEFSPHTYYLAHFEKIYNQSTMIQTTLSSSERCLNISELFNQTLLDSTLLHRIKYYHIPCQTRAPPLKCFYDEIHLCLCQQINNGKYVTNCFEFHHNMSLDCSGQSGCLNDGQCFEEQTSCPRISICKCPLCFYGSQCQLTSSGFSLSLDAILGYHIRPNLNLGQQPFAVLISLILTVIITILGFINGILTLITFYNKTTHDSCCGLYLFSSSIIVMSTMIIFFLKFILVLLSQMGTIRNELFLRIQCHLMDYFLRVCLTMDQWLTAFVAVERALTIIKGTKFNLKKSKLAAKYIIGCLAFVVLVTHLHDPIYRSLFEENNDEDEKRIWCIVNYSSNIRITNVLINIFHSIVPFIINVISALVIIIRTTRKQVLMKKKKYRDILIEEFHKHRHLLIGPCVLVILVIPRLIISFASGCMKSVSDSWLFLLGYFISLIPSLLTFILFVLPSTTYTKAFRQVISRYRHIIRDQQ